MSLRCEDESKNGQFAQKQLFHSVIALHCKIQSYCHGTLLPRKLDQDIKLSLGFNKKIIGTYIKVLVSPGKGKVSMPKNELILMYANTSGKRYAQPEL